MTARDHALPHRRVLLVALLAAVILTAAAIWLAFALLDPTPPRTVTMATDAPGSFSAELGRRYRDALARNGIELRLTPTAGAVESLEQLRDPRSGVGISIIPSGLTSQRQSPDLVSLGTLYYEPLWLFYRASLPLTKHEDLRGRRIAIGPEGSASHALAVEFLARVGIAGRSGDRVISAAPEVAADELLRGEVDAAVMMGPWETPLVRQLLADRRVELASVRRADALVALYPSLRKLVLPAGVGDMANNRPPADVVLLAPKASLVVRDDLHPAIQYLLLEAASQLHSEPGMFRAAGQFPAAESIDLPLSNNARQFYKTGTPFLQRHLPFWLAVLAQQALIVLIPVLGLLYPLLRSAPALYGWVMRRRVLSLYGELKFLEDQLSTRPAPQPVDDLVAQLNRLEERASRFRVPVSFRPLLYSLRLYINLVRQRIAKR